MFLKITCYDQCEITSSVWHMSCMKTSLKKKKKKNDQTPST